ncbi:MAG: phosphodiesterase [Selenomonadaceae bacterium]|nr:phosphodiesterase [Selenomonadaceae bacterium]MBR6342831.1 phosphodiesterase [Selenomonadaceae bacterium]MBR6709998.1 phosphodiesterase [Selenomonadaceae bacterium]MBR6905670.1 phosphodiesterase [Selenomonadaceae bacterium]
MKIGVISDTHGHEMRWAKAYEKFFKDADMILHAGDVLYHGPRNPMLEDYNPAGLAQRINDCPIPVVIAKGNCDSEVDQMVIALPIQAPYAYVMAEGCRIVMTHGHTVETDADKDKMAAHLKADIFITGHIHTNVLEKRGNTVFLNPGSPSLSKREDKKSTAAVITDDKIAIYDIDTGEALMQLSLK